jgi:aminopeptidase N
MKTLLTVLFVVAGALSASAQRLPANVVPTHYDITVEPDLAAATFAGRETITVRLEAPATSIVLNAAEITFQTVQIAAGGQTQTAAVTLDPAKDQATFAVPATIPAGEARIQIAYQGILNDDLRGLYLSKANNRRYAVTQLEATDARRMFPSFDEPAFKATFSLTAVIDAADHAISNGAVLSDTPGPRAGTHTVTFETTPKMSSYLLALAVGDFVCNEGSADAVPIRICSTPDKKALTGFALESTEQIIRYYDRYYTIKYPFKKLDVVAVPDFAAGAMENTAAIFYRETLLLADTDASVRTRQAIAGVLAHEIAHQWFGDLVTMQWWDDIWLNEGFANWMQSKPLTAWKPEWQVELTETADNQTAMNLDALRSTRPIRSRASTPNEINELFDPIAYEKGAAVLRMIESWVGEASFQKAINAYIDRYKYGNARAEDFWSTVAASTGKPVDRVMASFVDQPGVPLVSMSASCQGGHATVTLSQSRYSLEGSAPVPSAPQVWQLPVCLRTDSGRPACEILDQPRKAITLDACPAWTMPNAGGRGYYRASLDAAALKALEAHIATLSGPERLTLLADEWALVRSGVHDVGAYLELASAFGSEDSEPVLATVTATLRAIDRQMTTQESRPAFRAWVRKLLSPNAARLGWDVPRTGSSDNARALRAALLRELGEVREPDALAAARRLVDQELATPKSVDPTLLDVAVNVAAANGDATLYEKYLARSRSAVDPEDRYRFLNGLTSFTDPALVRRTMEYALGPDVRSQDTKIAIASLLANEAARDITWDMLRERWDAVQKKTGEFVGNTVIVNGLSSFCDARHAGEITAFFASHPVPDAERTLAQVLERINSCASLSAAQTPRLADWLLANK